PVSRTPPPRRSPPSPAGRCSASPRWARSSPRSRPSGSLPPGPNRVVAEERRRRYSPDHRLNSSGRWTMATKGNILVGTIRQGVLTSAADGESGTRASGRQAMHSDGIVKDLVPDPPRPGVTYAGTDAGLYCTEADGKWRLLDTPMTGSMVWSLAI